MEGVGKCAFFNGKPTYLEVGERYGQGYY